jgi:Tol biopolymer transport system component/DNA-binding winged helix-turn-helix (wHTH) protein
MSQQRFYDFDGFRLDAEDKVLLRDGEILPLTQKAFDVLLILVERNGRVVTKDELMTEVWADTIVEEGSLAQNIYTLRKLLGASSTGDDYIKTVPRRGYRFSATVVVSGTPEVEMPTVELVRQVELKKKKHGDEFQLSNGLAVTESELPAVPAQLAAPVNLTRISFLKSTVLGALVVVIGVVGWWIYRAANPSAPFSNISLTNLTTTGNVQRVALSPDGKYAVYGVGDKPPLSSLRITQLATGTTNTILEPEPVRYLALTVSPDGGYVYAVRAQNAINNRALYRVPLFGRVATKLLDNVETGVTFSPDGKQIAFRRGSNERRESILYIANADGTGEREVAAVKVPDGFSDPAWSPDGKLLATVAGHQEGGKNKNVVVVQIADGQMNSVLPERWTGIGQVAWLRDTTVLVMVGNKEPNDPIQLWRVQYPSGEITRITNDSNSYNRLSVSADGQLIAALQIKQVTSFWTAPADDLSQAQQITFGAGGYRGKHSWTPDGRIVYDSEAGDTSSISIMNADGSQQRLLTEGAGKRAIIGYASATVDGRYILYRSDQTGTRQIWRMNLDGSNPTQLTYGKGADHPAASPDGQWVVFTQQEQAGDGKPTLWKVSINGGEPTRLTNDFTVYPSVSPDGKMVACLYSPTTKDPGQPAIYSLPDGKLLKTFPQAVRSAPYIRWSPDGQSLVYAENPIGAATLWKQPIAGGAPQPLLKLEADFLYGFDWSRDGKRIAFVRGLWTGNIVLIKDGK